MSVAALNNNVPENLTSPAGSRTFTVNAGGTNRCAFVVATWFATQVVVTGFTLGGVAMTSAGTPVATADGLNFVGIWYLVNPTAGTPTLTAISTGDTSGQYIVANVVTFTGVNQAAPVRVGSYTSHTENTASTVAVTIPSNTSDLTISLTSASSTSPTITSTSQTSDGIQNTTHYAFASDHATTAASSITSTWTWNSGGHDLVVAGLSINGGLSAFVPQTGAFLVGL